MTISILQSTSDDSEAAIEGGMAAFSNDALTRATFMLDTASPEDLADFKRWRLLIQQMRMQGRGSHYFKAVDDETGKLVGLTGWYDPSRIVPSLDSVAYPKRMNLEVEMELRTKMKGLKDKYLAGRDDVWYVQSMFVHPDYQGRGIAARLLQTGLDEANKAGQDVYLEATTAGLPLYKKLGFQVLEVSHLETVDYTLHVMMHKAK